MTSGCPRRPCWSTWIPRTEGNALLLRFSCLYGGWWKLPDTPPPSLSLLQDIAEDQSGWRESRLTPSQSGCISVARAPPPPFPHLVASPVRMMSLTAVNTVSMETPTTALAYISGSSPSILQHHHHPPHLPHSASPPCHPADLTPRLRTEERWVKGGGGGGGRGGLTAVDRKNVMVRKTKTALKKKNNPSTGLVWGGGGSFKI